jgi:hypothetical protein
MIIIQAAIGYGLYLLARYCYRRVLKDFRPRRSKSEIDRTVLDSIN